MNKLEHAVLRNALAMLDTIKASYVVIDSDGNEHAHYIAAPAAAPVEQVAPAPAPVVEQLPLPAVAAVPAEPPKRRHRGGSRQALYLPYLKDIGIREPRIVPKAPEVPSLHLQKVVCSYMGLEYGRGAYSTKVTPDGNIVVTRYF